MKRVRFASPLKARDTNIMNYDTECHTPRPFVETIIQPQLASPIYNGFGIPRMVPYTNDPIQKFELSNSSPYPTVNKTFTSNSAKVSGNRFPSSDLDLSILDSACQEPLSAPPKIFQNNSNDFRRDSENKLKTVDSNTNLPITLNKNDDFFIKRENIVRFNSQQQLPKKLNMLTLDKENNALLRKKEILELGDLNQHDQLNTCNLMTPQDQSCCNCHHCNRISNEYYMKQQCFRSPRSCLNGTCVQHIPPQTNSCVCYSQRIQTPLNAIDKKNWEIEKYERSQKADDLTVNIKTTDKQKREPTVSDLFQIIKLQNEQLQLLQEKVDKFIASSSTSDTVYPSQKCLIDQTTTSNEEQHKISIGVMTSFEMVRTSTVINKEIIKQTEAQIQCNRSQISIKEVVSKSQPVNINFLEGIQKKNDTDTSMHDSLFVNRNVTKNTEIEDKTLNELSLYNLQVNNDTTPQMSPEPSLYLDVKDYSDTDSDSDDPANVGWTYYNKVMTRVNGLLQDSDMPSSASALYRNTKRLMQMDKTNISVTKRVTFGENPIQPRAPSTDTSLKMNQLAAKYLNNGLQKGLEIKPTTDMSFATKNYMEKHRIIEGTHGRQQELPKFLDMTVLKQQQKLL